jgi:hypothetical protein
MLFVSTILMLFASSPKPPFPPPSPSPPLLEKMILTGCLSRLLPQRADPQILVTNHPHPRRLSRWSIVRGRHQWRSALPLVAPLLVAHSPTSWHRSVPAPPPSPLPCLDHCGKGWRMVSRHKKWQRVLPAPAVRPSNLARPVPTDLVVHCFNCLRPDHDVAVYPNATRCLCCHREGHQAQACKLPRSPDSSAPLLSFHAHVQWSFST